MDRRGQWDGAFRIAQGHGAHQLLPSHGPPAGPAQPLVVERRAAQPFHQVRGVLPQHDGARGAGFVLARALVEEDRGNTLGGQSERQRQPDRAGADDDHRVHGVIPSAPVVGAEGRRWLPESFEAGSQNVCNPLPVLASSDTGS